MFGKSSFKLILSNPNHKTYQKRPDSALCFSDFWIRWNKIMAGIELVRYQTKFRPKEH